MLRVKKILGLSALLIVTVFLFLIMRETPISAGNVDLNNAVFSDFNDILFVKAQQGGDHMCDQYFGFQASVKQNNGLYILHNAFRGNKYVTNVLENSYCTNGRYQGRKLEGGAFLSPDLSYDGTRIVFAYTDASKTNTWNQNTTYHIFTVNIDGTNLTQLTDGNLNDVHPAWMPDGRIVFISERRGGYGRCHQRAVPTYTLHTMEADGSNIKCISYHETNEWWPSINNAGMIIYTRWDYVDRGATHTHSGWITKQDGDNPRPISLNYTNTGASNQWGMGEVPMMQMQLRPVPGSNKYIGTAAPHHWECYGSVILIDPDVEDDDQNSTITNITPDNNGYPESGRGGHKYGSPYALSEDFFLVSHSPSDNNHYGLYVIDSAGNKTLLLDDYNQSIQCPVPVRARKKPIVHASATAEEGGSEGGVMNVVNVYNSLLPFPEGTKIKAIQIWEPYVKPTTLATNPYISYESTESIWAGRNAKGLVGTVPVEDDGSARFTLPAKRPYYFQVIDESGTAVQSMRSDIYFVGGQQYQYCNGCHEPRHQASINPEKMPTAFRRAPSTITPDPVLKDNNGNSTQFLSFPRHIQPILNNKCISCHNGSRSPDLRQGSSDGTTKWYQSYYNLKRYTYLLQSQYPGSNWDRVYPRTEPGKFGARASRLYPRLESGHGNLSSDELHTFAIWLDSGIAQFFGAYTDIYRQLNGDVVEPMLH